LPKKIPPVPIGMVTVRFANTRVSGFPTTNRCCHATGGMTGGTGFTYCESHAITMSVGLPVRLRSGITARWIASNVAGHPAVPFVG